MSVDIGELAVSADDVWSIVDAIWESLLVVSPVRADRAFALDDALTASVSVHGDWSGLVTFTCPMRSARDIARTMLDLPVGMQVSHLDVEDAVGEVANVLGGNVKALVRGTTTLGLPSVVAGMAVHAELLCRTGVEWAGHVARVAVWRLAGTLVGSTEGIAR